LALDDDERRFFAASRPCGLILFRRNCGNPEQIRTLIADFKASVASDDVLVLVDQEGGRVERLKPPHWLHLPPAACYGRLYGADRAMAARAAFAGARLTAEELYDLGITVNTMPVLDTCRAMGGRAPTAILPCHASTRAGRNSRQSISVPSAHSATRPWR
jgi:beta-N-acetylhexosaminidase